MRLFPSRRGPRFVRFDVFLSYRVKSDAELTERLYYALGEIGLRVWWDQKCLPAGLKWQDGFVDGLFTSALFVPILSKAAITPFASLKEDSSCDNVLLEHRLALEAMAQGIIRGIFPLLIGERHCDTLGEGRYSSFFEGERPAMPTVAVRRVDTVAITQINNT